VSIFHGFLRNAAANRRPLHPRPKVLRGVTPNPLGNKDCSARNGCNGFVAEAVPSIGTWGAAMRWAAFHEGAAA
jgi:hypothetical protein